MIKFIHILPILFYLKYVHSQIENFSNYIKPDEKITKSLEQNVLNFYTNIDHRILDNDITIIANIENSKSDFESPIIYISRKPFPSNNLNSEWICGQLGKESCTIPRKSIKQDEKLYLGVKCDYCKVTLALTYTRYELLQEGEQKIFHLNKGDEKVFIFQSFNKNIEFVNIKSFNLKMTDYAMEVELVNEKPNKNHLFVGMISHDWVGGQQFLINNSDTYFSPLNKYKISFVATDNGVFTIEGRTSKTIVPLSDNMIKFDTLKPVQKTCYKYQIPDEFKNDKLILKMNIVKGDARFLISPISDFNNNFPIQMNILEKTNNYELPHSTRLKLNSEAGEWLICVESKKITAFYTLQVFLSQFSENNKTYQKNLESLLNSDNTYNLDDHQLVSSRLLLQSSSSLNANDSNATGTNVIKSQTKKTTDGISINGTGVAGIATFIIFLIVILIGITCIDNIFVSTKFVEHPLLLGKVEY